MSSFYQTAEVRWFFREKAEKDPVGWFVMGQPSDLRGQWADPRVDRYLLFPGCTSIGVKERESRFEIKALQGAAGTVRFPGRVTGLLEHWVKWSYGQAPVAAWTKALRQERERWIEVEKTRMLRTFSLDHGVLEEVSSDYQPGQGCTIELTKVAINVAGAELWWTIGLEAFGPVEKAALNLHKIANAFFALTTPPWQLSTVNSCSYPVWLHGLAHEPAGGQL